MGLVIIIISSEQWYDHFRNVFNLPPAQPVSRHEFIERAIADDIDDTKYEPLNLPITEVEIRAAIRALKNQKAARPDGLIAEFYKNSSGQILPFLVDFFKHLFDHGMFPNKCMVSIDYTPFAQKRKSRHTRQL